MKGSRHGLSARCPASRLFAISTGTVFPLNLLCRSYFFGGLFERLPPLGFPVVDGMPFGFGLPGFTVVFPIGFLLILRLSFCQWQNCCAGAAGMEDTVRVWRNTNDSCNLHGVSSRNCTACQLTLLQQGGFRDFRFRAVPEDYASAVMRYHASALPRQYAPAGARLQAPAGSPVMLPQRLKAPCRTARL